MFKQTIRFEREQDAHIFDLHLLDFLRECDQIEEGDAGCLFTTREVQRDTHIRVVQTDRPEILGRLLSFLSLRNFPPAAQSGERATSLGR